MLNNKSMAEAPKIRKLDETVVNRIAAGEVIQRPANALKEMLENSLDAKCSNITITVQQGGLRLLQIQDDGCGIRKGDLPILCERFTTSKLSTFDDLLKISTYGFRGEALSSISHVAHLTVVTKTSDSAVGYKAVYVDGKLTDVPKPCAALQGTQIKVEDLFYNVATRRKALKNPNEEHHRIVDVVGKYAVHNAQVGFCLKKNETTTDLKTPSNSKPLDNIRIIYGQKIAKELVEINGNDDVLQFSFSGLVTNANFSDKKLTLLLFINHRLVDSSNLRKILEHIYSNYLPKNGHPFIYLSINLNPANVDVNVHPTKHEVHFLHEESILEKIQNNIESTLVNLNSSRTVYTQGKLPTLLNIETLRKDTKKAPPKETVRVDSSEQKIDKFLTKADNVITDVTTKRTIKLVSVLNLRKQVEEKLHKGLLELIRNFSFVGVLSPKQCLLQHDTKLYLCAVNKLFYELFYQMLLFDFANFGLLRFSSSIQIKDILLLHLNDESAAENIEKRLIEKAPLLEDYFSIEIDSKGQISSLPLIIDQYVPDMSLLPEFLCNLYDKVKWSSEQLCLDGICKQLAEFYSPVPVNELEEEENIKDSDWKWQIEHIVLPCVKATLLPPVTFTDDGTILEIANLPDLYRVFERC